MDSAVLSRVLEVSRKMAETRALSPLLEYAMAEALDLVGAQRGYLALVRHDGTLDIRVRRDSAGKLLPDTEDPASLAIVGQTIHSGKPQALRNAASPVSHEPRSVICVLLIARGATLGAITVEDKKAPGVFDDADLLPLTMLASHAAVAIENALLTEELETRIVLKTAELRQALEQLEEHWQAAHAEDEVRAGMLSTVAHDVRVPLTLAYTAMSLLEDSSLGALGPDQQQWAHKARDATHFALDMLEDIFDISRHDLGMLELDLEITAVSNYLTEIAEAALLFRWQAGVEFMPEIPAGLPAVNIDRGRMRRVIFNLLSNSMKFTSGGRVVLYASVLPDQQVLIGVRDTGDGIPEGDQVRIFERFEQADHDPVRRKKGAGLGLAICREFVELHGGRIWVESAAGQGADFKFCLPVSEC